MSAHASPYQADLAASVSWLRAYSTPCSIRAIRAAAHNDKLDRNDARHLLTDGVVADGDAQFWDIQALRRAHVLRIVSAGAVACRPSREGDWLAVQTHLVLHEAGLALIRLTLAPELPAGEPAFAELARYSDAVWRGEKMEWCICLAGGRCEIEADVRRAMDAVMLPLHERLCGRSPDVAALQRIADPDERTDWLEERVAAGESLSAYPVTFGTAYELVWASEDAKRQARESVAELAHSMKRPPNDTHFLTPAEEGYAHDWFIGENRAVLALAGERERNGFGTFDSLRTQALEYLTLQRAALRAVQRATQVTITERRTIRRNQLQQWQRLVGALTDEYVLHDQIAALFRPLREHMRQDPRLRDPATLEQQVRQNLATFQDVIASAHNRVAIILSGLFGVVAAITLAPVAHEIELTVFQTGGSVSAFDNRHIVLSIAIDLLLLAVVTALATVLITRANRLRWPKR